MRMVQRVGDETLFEELFPGGKIRPGFSGIGGFRGRRDYTDDERIVLEYFFTNTESNVYCATDNMPGELWALLMGQYARSNATARDRLLELFRDVHKKDETETVFSLGEIAGKIREQEDIRGVLAAHLIKAGRFIDEYGVEYGHASLRDSGTIRICFEGLSQRVTKPLERAREAAYQEQSTRATLFVEENLGVAFEIRGTEFEDEMRRLNREEISLYNEVFERAKTYLNDKYEYLRGEADAQVRKELGDEKARLPNRVWDAAITEKAFDLARSLLPQNITTSLGMTMNTRRFMDMLTEWQSSELAEIRVLGRAAQIEAMKISPTLMKYGKKSDFVALQPKRRRELFDEMTSSVGVEFRDMPLSSRLIAHTPDLEDWVLASILFHGSDGSIGLEDLKEEVRWLDRGERRRIAESYVEGMGEHDLFDKVAEVGSVTFERIYDIGAMRDLQRQRGDRQQLGPYTVVGYHMRKEIEEMGLGDKFRDVMGKVKDLYDRMKAAGHYIAAEYVPVMANVIRHVTTKDPVQCFYEAGLRTQAAGADSYREIAKQEIEQVFELLPAFIGLIPYDPKHYPLNRLPEKVRGYIRREKRRRGA